MEAPNNPTTSSPEQASPDKNCYTLPNGDCIGKNCMHDPLVGHLLGKVLFFVGMTMMVFGLALGIGLLTATIAPAREQYPGQYAEVDPAQQEWFREQVSPKTGGACCSEADGEMVEEDIRDGQYWIRSKHTIDNAKQNKLATEWIQVPDDVVIREPNKFGRAVAWYKYEPAGFLQVRCFAPGSLF